MPTTRSTQSYAATIRHLRLALTLATLSAIGACGHFRDARDRIANEPALMPTKAMTAGSRTSPSLPAASQTIPAKRQKSGVDKPGVDTADSASLTNEIVVAASADAVVIFANVPDASCVHCSTTKVSVAPSGKVLVEEGRWSSNNWHYRRSIAHVGAARALAFSQRLSDVRPIGRKTLGSRAGCAAVDPSIGSIAIDWIEGDRHDQLSVMLACPSQNDAGATQSLLHAPDLLELKRLSFPWTSASR